VGDRGARSTPTTRSTWARGRSTTPA
jgi:hypothetical protein